MFVVVIVVKNTATLRLLSLIVGVSNLGKGKVIIQPSKLKFLLGRHLATNSFGLERLFYKSSRQVQNFRRHGD